MTIIILGFALLLFVSAHALLRGVSEWGKGSNATRRVKRRHKIKALALVCAGLLALSFATVYVNETATQLMKAVDDATTTWVEQQLGD